MASSILILLPRIPYPTKDGGALAMYQLIEQLHKLGYELHILSINTNKHYLSPQNYPALFHQLASFNAIDVNTNVKAKDAFFNLFSKQSYNVERFKNKAFSLKISEILIQESFDFVIFESLYTTPYIEEIKAKCDAKLLYRMHNIEYNIWENLTNNESSFLKKKYLKLLTQRLKKYELSVLSQLDELLLISKEDGQCLNENDIQTPIYYLPYGIEKQRFQARQIQKDVNSIYHLGSMDWQPNQEGIKWFIEYVWPTLRKEKPNLSFYIAGKNTPNNFYNYKRQGVEVLGEIDDAKAFHTEKNIMIVPLHSGSGMRIKIIEAMLLGKTIIATTKALEGINCTEKKEVLIANDASTFIQQIDWCLNNEEKANKIGENAQDFVYEHYEVRSIYKKLNKHLEALKDVE